MLSATARPVKWNITSTSSTPRVKCDRSDDLNDAEELAGTMD